MQQGLIVLGIVGAMLGLTALPHLQPFGATSPSASHHERQVGPRIYLTSEQADDAAAQGIIPPGTRSILNVEKKLRHGDFVWNDKEIADGRLTIRVDLQNQILSVFRNGHEIGTSVVLFGAEGKDTPIGTFPILSKIRDHRSSIYDAPMPFTLRLTPDGVAIHGSDVRWGAATHGCVGVPSDFAERLFEQARLGDEVEIVSSLPTV